MNKIKTFRLLVIFCLGLVFFNLAYADTVYLKNGSVIEGVIEQQTDKYIRINLGFGSTKLYRSKIKKIENSDGQEKQTMQDNWEQEAQQRAQKHQQQQIEEKNKIIKRRLTEELDDQKQQIEKDAIEYISKRNSIGVEAILNGKKTLNLLVDTGATAIMINKAAAKSAGFDRISGSDTYVILADGSKSPAKRIVLDKVKVGCMEAEDVSAVILTEERGVDYWDGLLGMSFLKHFDFKIDSENKKLILERQLD
ncbi:MAG: retropepsin-like aspartic protease [Candidatus Omnitrophota bacterium]